MLAARQDFIHEEELNKIKRRAEFRKFETEKLKKLLKELEEKALLKQKFCHCS